MVHVEDAAVAGRAVLRTRREGYMASFRFEDVAGEAKSPFLLLGVVQKKSPIGRNFAGVCEHRLVETPRKKGRDERE